ncbi:MAG: serine/threonine protein phosphatase [Devosia sp.]|uniref:metallophosphoesterase family protein n=1 Tax=Devosia sp. TaxID=1871048 RepID=UPI0024CAA23E|nr:metallophosphoesterase family protein [Devosia sp.]UYO00562.1 MAG: serine/threonine protein phosphatase [Devosia sp.]
MPPQIAVPSTCRALHGRPQIAERPVVISRLFQSILPPRRTPSGRARLVEAEWPAAIYAIGDVHGCREQLEDLQAAIVADASATQGEKWLVMLGDYVDRGPDSAGVLDLLMRPAPAGFRRICLCGNHEQLMLDFVSSLDLESNWLKWGGLKTLASYGLSPTDLPNMSRKALRQALDYLVPPEHLDFMRGLPVALRLPDVAFVHAGVRPDIAFEDQQDDDLIWIREPFLSTEDHPGYLVVHGHTPESSPTILPHRIGIDTCAFGGGPLTALRLMPGKPVHFLQAFPRS